MATEVAFQFLKIVVNWEARNRKGSSTRASSETRSDICNFTRSTVKR